MVIDNIWNSRVECGLEYVPDAHGTRVVTPTIDVQATIRGDHAASSALPVDTSAMQLNMIGFSGLNHITLVCNE